MDSKKLPLWNLIALTLCAVVALAACVPIEIEIGVPTPTPTSTPAQALAATLTPEIFPSLTPLATNTPTLTPLFFATSATSTLTPLSGATSASPTPSLTPAIAVQPPQQPQPNPSGCSGTPNITFTASRTTITVGESTTLSWTVTNADSIQIEPSLGGVITANASRNVSPNTTTTYTLTARCSNNTETRTVRVNVDDVGAGVRPDPAAPTAPSGFTASGFGTTVTFNWTDNSNNETGFKIYQDGVTNPVLSPGAHSGTGPQSAQLTGIGCNFSGKFYIVAVNAAGPSSNSPMPTAVTIPCAPTTFIATGERTTIHFRWNDTPNETGFQVYQQGTSATKVGPRLPSNTNNYDFDALFCNGEGTYFVRAVNGAGESADSPVDHAVTVPCPPTITGASAISATAVRVDYTDTSTIENGFHIYRTGRDEILKTTIPLPASGRAGVGFPDGLPCGQKYSYYVKAFNDAGESAASATTNGTTSACTVAVTFSTIKVLDDRQPFTGAQITCDLNAIYGDFHRWPNSGYITINSGETKPISVTIVKNLLRTEDLGVVVRCHENATFQLHPYMGEVAGDYEGSANWSAGTYCPIKSKSNGTVGTAEKLFEICYTIKVTP